MDNGTALTIATAVFDVYITFAIGIIIIGIIGLIRSKK